MINIISHIDDQASLYHLLGVCRYFRPFVIHKLYRNIQIHSLPNRPDQLECGRKCLQRLCNLMYTILHKRHLAKLVESFSFEAYFMADVEEITLPRRPVCNYVQRLIKRACRKQHDDVLREEWLEAVKKTDDTLREEWFEAVQKPSSADPILALLLPNFPRVTTIRLIFYSTTIYCDTMIYHVFRHSGKCFPKSAFKNLRHVMGDEGHHITAAPLWDNFQLFFGIRSIATIIGHTQQLDARGASASVAEREQLVVIPGYAARLRSSLVA